VRDVDIAHDRALAPAGRLALARIHHDERDVRALVAEEVVAVSLAVSVLVQRLAMVARDDDDRVARTPVGAKRIQDRLRGVVHRPDRSVVERADLLLVARVGRGVATEADGLVVLEASAIALVGERSVVRRRRRIRKVSRRKEDEQKEGRVPVLQPAHRPNRVACEELRVGRLVHLAQDRKEGPSQTRMQHG
jgi:hypothetical protein